MRYKLLGKSGLRVSELCLGTMTYGEEFGWGSNKKESQEVFDAFVEAGGNFFDTANHYTCGTSEEFLGEFIRAERDRYVIATKYTLNQHPEDPNGGGNHRKSLVQALEASLKRLGTDYIDLYWVHAWDPMTPTEEMMRALDDMVRAGKILYIGISNAPAWVVSRANTLAEFNNWTAFVGLQLQYSLIERTIEHEFFPLADTLDLAITTWSPIGSGVLTGKYHDAARPKGSRYQVSEEWGKLVLTPQNLAIGDAVVALAKEIGRSPAQVAINWSRQQSKRVIPIIGARTTEQIKDNLGCLDFELAPEQIATLDKVSRYPAPFPYNFLPRVSTLIHGEKLPLIDNHRA